MRGWETFPCVHGLFDARVVGPSERCKPGGKNRSSALRPQASGTKERPKKDTGLFYYKEIEKKKRGLRLGSVTQE